MQHTLINQIRYVPTLPTILAKLLALLNSERSSAEDLEGIIAHDQALCSKVLAVANSAYYGFRYKILTVQRAVVTLGYEEIRNICLGASLMGFLHPSSFRDREQAEQLWLHSVAAAVAGSLVGQRVRDLDPDIAFTAGLLHDLGKVALWAYLPDEVESVYRLMKMQGTSYRETELALDLDHAEAGKLLGRHWDLPPGLVEAMGYHHEPHSGLNDYPLVASAHLANFLVLEAGIGQSGDPDPPQLKAICLKRLGLDQEALDGLRADLEERREAVNHLWSTLLYQSG